MIDGKSAKRTVKESMLAQSLFVAVSRNALHTSVSCARNCCSFGSISGYLLLSPGTGVSKAWSMMFSWISTQQRARCGGEDGKVSFNRVLDMIVVRGDNESEGQRKRFELGWGNRRVSGEHF